MLDPLVILQAARQEATRAISIIEDPDEWEFMYDLINRVIEHQIGARPSVEITHEAQPAVSVIDSVDLEMSWRMDL